MSGFLASVRSSEEALIAIQAGVDIIDLKEPSVGALGAVPFKVMRDVVNRINGEHLVSATVGDIPCEPLRVADMVRRVAETGVDLIKVGLFEPFEDQLEDLLWTMSQQSTKGIIIVVFADQYPGDFVIDAVADAGLAGIMLDTADKSAGSLREVLSDQQIERFLQIAKGHNLITGLAGSLSKMDIASLKIFNPDYLGFRSALCRGHDRKVDLDIERLVEIKNLIQRKEGSHIGAVA